MTAGNGHKSDGSAERPGGSGPPSIPRVQRTQPALPSVTQPSVDHLARSIAAALARTLRAYLPIETRSVEARLDALEATIAEVQRRVSALGESVAHGYDEAS